MQDYFVKLTLVQVKTLNDFLELENIKCLYQNIPSTASQTENKAEHIQSSSGRIRGE